MAENCRLAAVRVMRELHTHGGSLTRLLPPAQATVADADRALLQAFCFGMCRWSGQLAGLVDQLLKKPFKRKDLDVYLLLQLGVLQLEHMRVAPHAAVDVTVEAAGGLRKPWARGLVNGVLRNYQRQREALHTRLDDADRLAHPQWLLDAFAADWPDDWADAVEAGNGQAPMTLRVNRRHGTREQWRDTLQESGVAVAACHPQAPDALVLEQPVPVDVLPGFVNGDVSVQDAAAQLAVVELMNALDRRDTPVGSKRHLLDACAAPGGKSGYLLEWSTSEQLVALDQDAARLDRVRETLDRLQLAQRARLQAVDAADVDQWWDGRPFDAVLLDAPCSGTGVIRRHPDIKLLRRPSDLDTLEAEQARLMDALWQVLAPGGVMMYATCSILKRENEQQVQRFLHRHTGARCLPFSSEWGMQRPAGVRQVLPGQQDMDGFFYALLGKAV